MSPGVRWRYQQRYTNKLQRRPSGSRALERVCFVCRSVNIEAKYFSLRHEKHSSKLVRFDGSSIHPKGQAINLPLII